MGLPPCAAVSDREGVVLCADRPSAGMHAMDPRLDGVVLARHKVCRGDAHQRTAGARAMAQDLSMVGLDRAKSAYTSVVAWMTPARWCARRPACVPCLGVSGSVEPPHTALARLERPPDVAARILVSSVLHPSPRVTSGPLQSARRRALGGVVRSMPHRAQGGGMPTRHRMELGLYDARGHRKYLTIAERTAFLSAAEEAPREVRTLCGLLAHTGCRLSEALWLTADRVDLRADLVVFETLKKRRSGVYRAVPVPHTLVDMLDGVPVAGVPKPTIRTFPVNDEEENAGLRPHIRWTKIPDFVHVYRGISRMNWVCFPTAAVRRAHSPPARRILQRDQEIQSLPKDRCFLL